MLNFISAFIKFYDNVIYLQFFFIYLTLYNTPTITTMECLLHKTKDSENISKGNLGAYNFKSLNMILYLFLNEIIQQKLQSSLNLLQILVIQSHNF